ncbi:MAG: hypothetical protein K0S92_263, partial [Desertimonas sp.]|nr:hypothetical protein [Desertimonas sp.]
VACFRAAELAADVDVVEIEVSR